MNVVTVGGATLDIIVAGIDDARQLAGAKHDVGHIQMYPGGGAINAALSFRKLGAFTTVLCAVGADVEGDLLRDALRNEGIDQEKVHILKSHSTGKAVIFVDAAGDAEVFAQRGASSQLVIPADGFSRSTDILYISALSHSATEQLSNILDGARDRPRSIVFNPSSRQIQQRSMAFERLMKSVDLVCVNEYEAQLMADAAFRPVQNLQVEDAILLATVISDRYECNALLTLGNRGALFKDAVGVTCHSALPVKPQSTLGAGDAFCSTFAFGWVSGLPAAEALAGGARAAADVINTLSGNLFGPIGFQGTP